MTSFIEDSDRAQALLNEFFYNAMNNNLERSVAVGEIPSLIAALPANAEELMEIFLDVLKEDTGCAYFAAIDSMPKVIDLMPHYADLIVEEFLKAHMNRDYHIRVLALEQSAAMIAAMGNYSEALADMFVVMCSGVPSDVFPFEIEDDLDADIDLEEGDDEEDYDDEDADEYEYEEAMVERTASFVRSCAATEIPGVVQAVTYLAKPLSDIFIKMVADPVDRVRESAIDQTYAMMQAVPECARDFGISLLQLLEDPSSFIRRRAVSQIHKVINYTPELEDQLEKLLLKMLQDESYQVRSTAIMQLTDLFRSKPSKLELLEEAFVDALIARGDLVKSCLPCESVIAHFLRTHDQRLVSIVAEKLLWVPFFAHDSCAEPGMTMLSLEKASSDIHEWKMPAEEAKILIHLLQEEIKLMHPNLAKLVSQN